MEENRAKLLIEAKDLIKLYKNNTWKNNIVIFDASWYLPNLKRNPYIEYKNHHIPKAQFFDIDEISNQNSNLPHMAPSTNKFNKIMKKMGVTNNSFIIIYSLDGIGTSPRTWWLFKLFGHNKVSILNGGLKAWLKIKGPIDSSSKIYNKKSHYSSKYNKKLICNYDEVIKAINNKNLKIIDARSEGRFKGIDPEPRPGLKKGHIPNSINLPFNLFINKKGYLLEKKEIKKIIKNFSINNNTKIISTCGSGVTACVLAFVLNYIGFNNCKIYDGSWSEWGSIKNSTIEK